MAEKWVEQRQPGFSFAPGLLSDVLDGGLRGRYRGRLRELREDLRRSAAPTRCRIRALTGSINKTEEVIYAMKEEIRQTHNRVQDCKIQLSEAQSKLEEDEDEDKENEVSEESVRSLLDQVIGLEKSLKEKNAALLKQKDQKRRKNWYYKTFLDIDIEIENADILVVYPSKSKKDQWVKLRRLDCKEWEFVDMAQYSQEMEEPLVRFKEDNNVSLFLFEARKYFKRFSS